MQLQHGTAHPEVSEMDSKEYYLRQVQRDFDAEVKRQAMRRTLLETCGAIVFVVTWAVIVAWVLNVGS